MAEAIPLVPVYCCCGWCLRCHKLQEKSVWVVYIMVLVVFAFFHAFSIIVRQTAACFVQFDSVVGAHLLGHDTFRWHSTSFGDHGTTVRRIGRYHTGRGR